MAKGLQARGREATAPEGYRMFAKGKRGEIYLYGLIGSAGWFGDGTEVSATRFQKDLEALGDVTEIDLHINSEGGDVMDGTTIYTLLHQHKARVTAHVDGLAASAASYIAMAADQIRITESGFMMVHQAWGFARGPSDEMRRRARLLDQIDVAMAGVYSTRTGIEVAEIQDLMRAETWMGGADAVARGFADELVPSKDSVQASVRFMTFANLPAALRPNRSAAARIMAGPRA